MRLLSLSLLTLSVCCAQIQTGRITGSIYDPNRAVIANALITVTDKATGVARQTRTNEIGTYVVPALNPGVYDVSASAPGFRTLVRSGVEMQVGRDLLLDLELVIGETTTTLEVTADVALKYTF